MSLSATYELKLAKPLCNSSMNSARNGSGFHRLCCGIGSVDSDVMVMCDTTSYFSRRWTREEFGKASLKKAAILRVSWPGVDTAPSFTATDTVALTDADLTGSGLRAIAVDRITGQIERLRSLSIAARHANLIGSLRKALLTHLDDLEKQPCFSKPRRGERCENPGLWGRWLRGLATTLTCCSITRLVALMVSWVRFVQERTNRALRKLV